MDRLTDEELAHMTPAEREGYELMMSEAEEEGDDTDIDGEEGGDDDTAAAAAEDEGEDGEQEEEQEVEAEQPSTEGTPPATQEPATSEEAGDDEDEIQFPADAQKAVSELTEKLAQNESQQEALLEQFDDGELTREEYAEKLAELRKENQQFTKDQAKAEGQIENAIEAYRKDVRGFLKDHAEYKPGGLLHKALDDRVKELQQASDNPLSPKLIRQAHKQIQEELGLVKPGAKEPSTPGQKETGKTVTPKPTRELPPNLNALPAAEVNDATDDDGRYAVLARLAKTDPIAHEKALLKMTEAEQDEYLRYGG